MARGPIERTPPPISHRACACPGRSARPASAGLQHSLLALALALAFTAFPALAQPTPDGPPFVLSAQALAALGEPRVAAAPGGEAVALWLGECPLLAVCARTWNAAGALVAGPFALPIEVAELDAVPALAAAPGGGFWVVWSRPADALARRVVARRFGAGGAATTPERIVAAASAQIFAAPDVEVDAGGAPLVVWERRRFEGVVGGRPVTVGVEVQGRRLDASGVPLGTVFRIDEDDLDLVSAPALALAANGTFLVAWESFGFDAGEEDVLARAFTLAPDGGAEPFGGQRLAHPPSADAEIRPAAASDGGGFLIVWEEDGGGGSAVFARGFDAAGPSGPAPVPLGDPAGERRRPAVAGGDGVYVVLWEEATGGALFGQRRQAGGVALDPAFRVDAGGGTALAPAVAALPGEGGDSGLLAAWSEAQPDGSRRLLARRYPGAVAAPAPCVADAATLCLGPAGRFRVTATWSTDTDAGAGTTRPLTADTGTFWFFDAANLELVVKTLAACPVNGHHWVFAAGLTDVAVELVVEDTATGARRTYSNPPRTPFQPIQDTAAFPCP